MDGPAGVIGFLVVLAVAIYILYLVVDWKRKGSP